MPCPTLAPWTYSGGEILDAKGNQICQLYDSFRDPAEDDANGLLMAAAPQMLAALNECLGLAKIAETLTGCRSDDDYVWGIRELIENTIAKAEGRS